MQNIGRFSIVQFMFQGKNLSQEVKNCLIPNCVSTTWKMVRKESYPFNYDGFALTFDSGLKVIYTYVNAFGYKTPYSLALIIGWSYRRVSRLHQSWLAECLWRLHGTVHRCQLHVIIWQCNQLFLENHKKIKKKVCVWYKNWKYKQYFCNKTTSWCIHWNHTWQKPIADQTWTTWRKIIQNGKNTEYLENYWLIINWKFHSFY